MLQSMIFKVIHGHLLLLHFLPSMQNECWLNSDWSWSSGEILPLLDQKNEGYTGVNSFFSLKLSSMRFQARHIWRDTSCAYYGRISLSDGLRMSQMMFSCPSLRAFIIAFILFSLPLLQRASAHISAAAIQLCSMRGDSNHFPLQHQLIIWETNEGKIIQWNLLMNIEPQEGIFLSFWPVRITFSPTVA